MDTPLVVARGRRRGRSPDDALSCHCLDAPARRLLHPGRGRHERGIDTDHWRAGRRDRIAARPGLRLGPGDGGARPGGLRARVRCRRSARAWLRGRGERRREPIGLDHRRASGGDGCRPGRRRWHLSRRHPWCNQARAGRRRHGERRGVAVAGHFGAPRVRPPAPRAGTLRLETRPGARLSRHRCGALRFSRAGSAATRRHPLGRDRSRSVPAPGLARRLGRMDALRAVERRRRAGGDRVRQPSRGGGRGGGCPGGRGDGPMAGRVPAEVRKAIPARHADCISPGQEAE